jgi:asparagine N-glycosylation enzyme membrane subunit Stt3
MNGIAPGVRFQAITPQWVILLIIADAIICVLIVLALCLIARRVKKQKTA